MPAARSRCSLDGVHCWQLCCVFAHVRQALALLPMEGIWAVALHGWACVRCCACLPRLKPGGAEAGPVAGLWVCVRKRRVLVLKLQAGFCIVWVAASKSRRSVVLQGLKGQHGL
jgi:hypothetical protein